MRDFDTTLQRREIRREKHFEEFSPQFDKQDDLLNRTVRLIAAMRAADISWVSIPANRRQPSGTIRHTHFRAVPSVMDFIERDDGRKDEFVGYHPKEKFKGYHSLEDLDPSPSAQAEIIIGDTRPEDLEFELISKERLEHSVKTIDTGTGYRDYAGVAFGLRAIHRGIINYQLGKYEGALVELETAMPPAVILS